MGVKNIDNTVKQKKTVIYSTTFVYKSLFDRH